MSWIIAVLLGLTGLHLAQESEIGFFALAVAVIWLIIFLYITFQPKIPDEVRAMAEKNKTD